MPIPTPHSANPPTAKTGLGIATAVRIPRPESTAPDARTVLGSNRAATRSPSSLAVAMVTEKAPNARPADAGVISKVVRR